LRIGSPDRQQADRHVFEQLRRDAAVAEQHRGTELRVAMKPEDHLDAAAQHFLDQEAVAGSFAMSYIHRGLIPDGGGLYFLPRRVGLPRAKELIFTGRRVAPDEALRIGMIDRIAAPETLLAQARAWAAELSRGSCCRRPARWSLTARGG
jgi:hypothetical protein